MSKSDPALATIPEGTTIVSPDEGCKNFLISIDSIEFKP